MAWMAITFVLVAAALQWGWAQFSGLWVERLVIDDATVGTAVTLINAVTPHVHAVGHGSKIDAFGGGINILNGCEGTEVWFLLIGALMAYPLLWRSRLLGIAIGAGIIFVLNQARLLALFYSFRSDPALFNHLHTLVAPVILIAATVLLFAVIVSLDQRLARASHDNHA